jgi:Leucine-rich repeat (LRR) protein
VGKKNVLLLFILIFIAGIASVLFYQQMSRGGNPAPENGVLDLSNQGLEKLPAYVLKLSNLEELDISNNKITGALPAEIHDLKKLRVLDASDNLMTGVPAEVGQLQNLEVLDLSNNRLTGLPYELGNLKKLKQLNLSGNDYAQPDLEIIKAGLSPEVEIIL